MKIAGEPQSIISHGFSNLSSVFLCQWSCPLVALWPCYIAGCVLLVVIPYESSWLLWHTRFSMIKSPDVISKVTQRLNRCDRSWSNWWKDTFMIWMKMSYFEKISRKRVPVEGLMNRSDDWSLSVLVCEGSLIYLTEVLCELGSLTNFYLCSESMVQKRFESEGYLLVKNPFLNYT